MAGDVVAVLDAAGIGRAHVLGASLGGMVAQELAIRHAERVDRLVLACTTPGWPFAYPMPAPSVRLLAARIPRARLVIFPDLGHLLFWEDPDRFAGAVTAFLLGGGPRS
jgi:pimeloyl-ACP methyl ester carboxylesterase